MPPPSNGLKRSLRSARPTFGLWSMSGSPVVAEALGQSGHDFVVLDMEHAPTDAARIFGQLQALAGTPTPAIVRLPWNDPIVVKQLLDMGAQTLMFPNIQSGEEAKNAVGAMRYPPDGIRGVAGMSRATRYGGIPGYFRDAAGELCTILQIETRRALANLEAIGSVDGVDSLFIGPNDLAADLGHVGQPDHAVVLDAIADAASRCRLLGKPCGILAPDVAHARRYLAAGVTWVATGSDLGLMMAAARASIAALRDASPPA